MAYYAIKVELPFGITLPAGGAVSITFPNLAEAVRQLAEFGQAQWLDYARGAPLPDGRSIPSLAGGNGEYLRSIVLSQQGDLHWRVSTDWPGADRIEEGLPSYDMKQMLRTSAKVRVNKRGGRYLIIPFQHGTPGTVGFRSVMPEHVYELARQMRASHVTGSRRVNNAIGLHDIATRKPVRVVRRTYSYGDRLPAGLVSKAREGHRTDQMAGMYRFDSPTGGHSRFLTFRTMSERSQGWIRGAIPGFWPARTVAEQIRPQAEAIFQEALQEDVKNYLRSLGLVT
ncbi:MAG TPA: hypothetical protein VNX47_02510 [Nevskia sp.]|jgi:hypothetical protein|nr:hypothetical protein [Nevskia sp.]